MEEGKMKENKKSLITPVYINEKIVIDMLAIIEDGFSTVSQVSTQENKEDSNAKSVDGKISSSNIIEKFLRIDLGGRHEQNNSSQESEKIEKEKVHTNVSLLSKFRDYLVETNSLKRVFKITELEIGDFVEIQGELKKIH